jgi:hypothetical protein
VPLHRLPRNDSSDDRAYIQCTMACMLLAKVMLGLKVVLLPNSKECTSSFLRRVYGRAVAGMDGTNLPTIWADLSQTVIQLLTAVIGSRFSFGIANGGCWAVLFQNGAHLHAVFFFGTTHPTAGATAAVMKNSALPPKVIDANIYGTYYGISILCYYLLHPEAWQTMPALPRLSTAFQHLPASTFARMGKYLLYLIYQTV